ncbi:MAG: hypothetical protein ACTHOI_06655 [Sphingomicrobium sp.]
MSRPKAVMHSVALVAKKDGTDTYQFQPRSDLWNEPEEEFVFHKDKHGMRAQDYHLVEFTLDDRTGDGLKFPETPHDAMCVTKGAERAKRQCPDLNTASDYSVMEPICVCDDQRRLIVRNDNPRREDWAFTLNFVKRGENGSDQRRYVNWDPGGANHDGGSQG